MFSKKFLQFQKEIKSDGALRCVCGMVEHYKILFSPWSFQQPDFGVYNLPPAILHDYFVDMV